jgi:membrane-anchored protein YejM (alkaline phosphatase superfamily)
MCTAHFPRRLLHAWVATEQAATITVKTLSFPLSFTIVVVRQHLERLRLHPQQFAVAHNLADLKCQLIAVKLACGLTKSERPVLAGGC